MDLDPNLAKVGIDLGTLAAKNSAHAIMDKIRAIKTSSDKGKVIGSLEEIINDLISDKNQLIQLVQSYEERLILQKISDEDIDFITQSIVPLLEELLNKSPGEEADKAKEAIDLFKPILSKETFHILQLLGFNFQRAIGEPLTQLAKAAILSKIPMSSEVTTELQLVAEQKQIEYFKIIQDEESFQRLLRANGQQ